MHESATKLTDLTNLCSWPLTPRHTDKTEAHQRHTHTPTGIQRCKLDRVAAQHIERASEGAREERTEGDRQTDRQTEEGRREGGKEGGRDRERGGGAKGEPD